MITTFDETQTLFQLGHELSEYLDDYDIITDMQIELHLDGSLSLDLSNNRIDVPSDVVFNPDKWPRLFEDIRGYLNGGVYDI